MTDAEQLAWERRLARPAAAAAAGAAVLLVGSVVYLQASLSERVDGTAEQLQLIEREGSTFIVSGAIQALGLLLLVPVLLYLFRATKHRRPETASVVLPLAVLGAVGSAAIAIVRWVLLGDLADDFLEGRPVSGMTRDERAEQVIDDSDFPIVGGVGIAVNLSLGLSVLVVSVGAMRAGLTSKFLGIIGIIVGVLYVLPVAGGPQIVQLFWLGALAALFLGRWPGGRGPAWESASAEPWPSPADKARLREDLGIGGEEPASADPDVPRANGRPAARSRKRKKKRR